MRTEPRLHLMVPDDFNDSDADSKCTLWRERCSSGRLWRSLRGSRRMGRGPRCPDHRHGLGERPRRGNLLVRAERVLHLRGRRQGLSGCSGASRPSTPGIYYCRTGRPAGGGRPRRSSSKRIVAAMVLATDPVRDETSDQLC